MFVKAYFGQYLILKHMQYLTDFNNTCIVYADVVGMQKWHN